LAGAVRDHLAAGFERVVLLGSDTPHLPGALVERAVAALDAYDVTLGPAADGGYYLLALSRPYLELFEHITWGTATVCAETRARARSLALRVRLLPEWRDIDTAADLRYLAGALRQAGPSVAPATRTLLASPGLNTGA
jgi:hypothetical protein